MKKYFTKNETKLFRISEEALKNILLKIDFDYITSYGVAAEGGPRAGFACFEDVEAPEEAGQEEIRRVAAMYLLYLDSVSLDVCNYDTDPYLTKAEHEEVMLKRLSIRKYLNTKAGGWRRDSFAWFCNHYRKYVLANKEAYKELVDYPAVLEDAANI
jgi:hypothetical protein